MMEYIAMLILGLLISALGIVNIMGNIIILPAVTVGLGFILYGQFKYNHVIF